MCRDDLRPNRCTGDRKVVMLLADSLEKSRADAVGYGLQIHKSQKVDGLELAVNGGRSAQSRGNIEVGKKEARRARSFRGRAPLAGAVCRVGQGTQQRGYEVFVPEGVVESRPFLLIL